jgi:peptidoglycan-associated lipoprotein
MHPRLQRLALVVAGAAILASCGGTVGTVEDTAQPDTGTASDSATASGTGVDSVSSTDTTQSDINRTETTREIQGHPLDNPDSVLADRTIYFEYDSSEVRESAQAIIEAHAAYLSDHPNAQITLEGHADERGSREYNVALGEQRAVAVRRLMTLLGATSQQIRTISYGEERPVATGHGESSWHLNRRVEVIYRIRE